MASANEASNAVANPIIAEHYTTGTQVAEKVWWTPEAFAHRYGSDVDYDYLLAQGIIQIFEHKGQKMIEMWRKVPRSVRFAQS